MKINSQTKIAYFLTLGFLVFHIFALKVLRYNFGWRDLFMVSYVFLGLIFYLWKKNKITKIGFVLLSFLPLIIWTFSHIINLIKYSPYGWVSIIFSIYFFVPYTLVAIILLVIVLKNKSKGK